MDERLTFLYKNLVASTRLANSIDLDDVPFYRTSDPEYASRLKDTSSKILAICNSLLNKASKEQEMDFSFFLKDLEDVNDELPKIVEVVDNMLEKTVFDLIQVYPCWFNFYRTQYWTKLHVHERNQGSSKFWSLISLRIIWIKRSKFITPGICRDPNFSSRTLLIIHRGLHLSEKSSINQTQRFP